MRTKAQILAELTNPGVIAVVRAPKTEMVMPLSEALIAGGVIALVVALGHGYLKTACRNLWMLLTHWRVMGVRPVHELTLEGARGPRLAYAVPTAIGTLVTLWLK